MSAVAAITRVSGGQVTVVVRRDACPPDERPCGEECPFAVDAEVGRAALSPVSPRMRALAELVYRAGLSDGAVTLVRGGAPAHIEFEVEGEGDGPFPVRSVRLTMAGHTRVCAGAALCRTHLDECRCADMATTGRVARRYSAIAEWSSVPLEVASRSRRCSRQTRPPALLVGARIVEAPRPVGEWTALHRPSAAPPGGPPIDLVWRDVTGLERATQHAAADTQREVAFLLVGAGRFDSATRRPFTEVMRVEPVSRYEARSAHVASIAPESLAAARRSAAASGLDVVGVLHSHVLETVAEAEAGTVDGLFYSNADAFDHERLFPSAWSIGAVLNVRPGGVEMGAFTRDEGGSFVPLEGMWTSRSE